MATPILLIHECAPGDTACMTASVRDLAVSAPGEFEIHVKTHAPELWDHNPHVAGVHRLTPARFKRVYTVDYGWKLKKSVEERQHFLTSFHAHLGLCVKRDIPCLQAKPDLHLSPEQRAEPPVEGRYWYIIAGGKSDFTTKIWSAQRWQQTVDVLRERGLRFVQGGAVLPGHRHPRLDGVLNTIGRTSLRDMLWMIYHADGVICTITAAMHIAAAFEKPCVVIAGGREHWWWEAYGNFNPSTFGPVAAPVAVPHRYLHTQDLLHCCSGRGCWRNKVLRAEPDHRRSYCDHPVDDGCGQRYPLCLDMIHPGHVVDAVMSYYAPG